MDSGFSCATGAPTHFPLQQESMLLPTEVGEPDLGYESLVPQVVGPMRSLKTSLVRHALPVISDLGSVHFHPPNGSPLPGMSSVIRARLGGRGSGENTSPTAKNMKHMHGNRNHSNRNCKSSSRHGESNGYSSSVSSNCALAGHGSSSLRHPSPLAHDPLRLKGSSLAK